MDFLIAFYLPITMAVGLLVLAVLMPVPKVVGHHGQDLKLELHLGIVTVPLGMSVGRIKVLRLILVGVAAGLLAKAISINVTNYFPQRLAMDVYFDERGISRNLLMFDQSELTDLALAPEWANYLSKYDQEVLKNLLALWKSGEARVTPRVSDFARNFVHARGETTFKVQRVGFLSYMIRESEGRLEYQVEPPARPPWRFTTFFKLRDTPSNHIRPSIRDILTSASLTIRPEFKEILSIDKGEFNTPFDHVIIGLTKISLFPLPEFSNTVYFWRMADGRAVPVAYAVYIPHDVGTNRR